MSLKRRHSPSMTIINLVLVPGERPSRVLRDEFQTDDGGGAGEVSQPGVAGRGRLATAFNCALAHAVKQLACVPYDTTTDLCVTNVILA